MNKSQQRSLQIHGPDLIKDLELNADLIAKLIHHGIFNEDMIDEIKSVKPRKEQIQKMLLQLSRRGPRAFDLFVHSIHEHYQWLAEDLRNTQHRISQKKGTETITMKEMVDITVHEKFGQSKRLSEEDKKEIRKFLYKQLKSHSEDGLHCDINSRRNSIQSDVSDNLNQPEEEEADINKNKIDLLKQVYNILKGQSDLETEDSDDEKVTVEMIEKRAYELNRKVEDLQNEIKDCYSVLGLEDCKYSLHEVLETYKEKNQSQVAELAKFQERVEKLKRQKGKLEDDLKAKEKKLQKYINNLANEEHENERSKALIEQLRSDCDRLDRINSKHLEKEQTLLALKSMVKDLRPLARESHDHLQPHYGLDEVDGNTLHLPKLSKPQGARSTRISRRSTVRDSSHDTHNEYPHPKSFGGASPWKY